MILNPHAGRENKYHVIKAVVEALDSLEIIKTKQRGDATLLAKQTDADIILAAGGDGTINEVINGILRNKKKKPVLGIIPIGTSNLCAKSLGIPLINTKAMVEIIKKGRKKSIDIGKINERYFVIACGVGLDAEMYQNVEPDIKKFFGEVAYPISLLKTMFSHRFQRLLIKVTKNNKTTDVEGYYALICNMGKYTKLFQVIPEAKCDDGLLDILIFKNSDLISQFTYLFNMISKTQKMNKDILYMQGEKFVIKSGEEVLAHADAEIVGTTPVEISLLPKCIEVLAK